uniref:Spectrin repeat containing, nuclear envelope 2b n=1 Tax=Oncorhynchus tshawytscha TaxID=74940 RepID=A0A8C8GUS6_ONCTS
MGQRGLAWRGDDSHPEGLKTHIRDTHTHPGGSPAAHILTEDVQTLTEVTVDTSVPKDIQTVTPVILPTMRLSKVDSRLVLSEAGQACLVQPLSEKALVVPEQRLTVPQPMLRKKKSAPQTGLLTAPSQPIEMALNVSTGQTHTASDLTHQTPVQVEASTPLAAPEEAPTTTTLGVVSTHTVPQTTLKPTEEDMEGVHPAATLAPGVFPAPALTGACPTLEVLYAYSEQATQLEVWLERAQHTLGVLERAATASMQDSVEQQLLTCQEMFLEIEQKVASLSVLEQQEGSAGSHQEAELLSSKLELLKTSLVTFQLLLQERQSHEQMHTSTHTEEQVPSPSPSSPRKLPLEGRLQRSGSVQEILSSSKSKLFRQTSFQQQKELEQELSEQRGLTKAIAQQGSRGRLHSQAQKDQPEPSTRVPVEPEGGGEAGVQRKWTHLHNQLLALEQTAQQGPSDGTDSSVSQSNGSASSLIDSHSIQDIQTHICRLRELGQTASEVVTQSVPDEEVHQRLDEGLFEVLCGVGLSLSSLTRLLQSPSGKSHEDTQLQLMQLETLAAELVTLGGELTSQGSEVIGVLGSGGGHLCVDHLGKLLPVVQSGLAAREKQLQAQLEKTGHHQTLLKELHAALLANKLAVQQMTNEAVPQDTCKQLQAVVQVQGELQLQSSQVSSLQERAERQGLPSTLIEEAYKLEVVLESVLGSVGARREELRASVDLQQQFERLLHGLEVLVTLGSERLSQRPGLELHTRTELQDCLSTHSKFFQFLGIHLGTLQHLSTRVAESTLQRWEGGMRGLRERVTQLQQQALERGTRMQWILQIWTQWEEESTSLDTLLRDMDAGLSKMHLEEDSVAQICEKLSVYQKMRAVLDESGAKFSRMQEQGRWLKEAGCQGVGVFGCGLEARWTTFHFRLEQQRISTDRNRKLWIRFSRDFVALSKWIGGAREHINSWITFTLTANQEQELKPIHSHLNQYMDFTKELEVRSALKASVITTGTQLLQLREAETAPEPQSAAPEPCSVQTQLRQIEQDWAGILSDIPAVQQTLHQLLMERQSPQGALTELLAWVGETEARLEEQRDRVHQTTSPNANLNLVLQSFKVCKAEIAVRQLTVDYVNQSELQTSRGRYEHPDYADELGGLNHRWLSLQGTLNNQIQDVEQELRMCTEREVRLQHHHTWLTSQREWMGSAQRPVSHSEVEKSLKTCEGLEEKLWLNYTALQELREKHHTGKEDGTCAFITQTDDVIKACTALSQENPAVRQRLKQVLELWAGFEKGLNDATLDTVKTCQAMEYSCFPQLSLQALQGLHEKLQLLRKETEGCDSEWDGLIHTLSILRDMISPTATFLMSEQLDRERTRWNKVNRELENHLNRIQTLLQIWGAYARLSVPFSQRLQTLRDDVTALMNQPPGQDNTTQLVAAQIQAVHSLQERTDSLQTDLEGVLEASKELSGRVEPSSAVFIQSESRMLTRGVLHLSQSLADKLGHLQEEHEQLQEFESVLASLEKHLEDWEGRLKSVTVPPQIYISKMGLLELSGFSPDLDILNELSYRLTLSDPATHRLQSLNWSWAQASARAVETYSELQTESLRQQSFQEKCENWMDFLQTMEDSLAVDLASTYSGLREQLRTHQRFQLEMSIGHQILHSVINDSLHLLQRGDVDDRSDFILKLAQLREHWQGAVQRAAQRSSLVEGLVKHWHLYSRYLRKLQRFVADAQALLPPTGPAHCSLQQLRSSLYDMKHLELLFQRYQCSYIHTLELGRQLFSMGDEQTQAQLQTELATLQEDWENLQGLLEKRKDITNAIIQNWERCEARLSYSMQQLDTMQTGLKQSIPEHDNELQVTEKLTKEAENSLDDWAESLTELATMKTDLSQYIIADDVLLLQEQVEHLHCQWEELCLKVSLRKQEIADRLNAWIIFNEKNKELCEWLTQMENKVAHNADISIEEMVEKLKKDCMEEINLFSENKTHLKLLGEQLITASNKTKETEVNDKLKDINDRWQHLFDHIETRVRKLKETLVTVQQLDKNMSNLRTWLSRIEAELAKPVVYSVCHSDEIQRKLAEQQDLQRDIEQHTEGVASVLTLCDVLLHDADACGSDTENDSIQQTTRSLDRRWRNICAMSMERRMRIEETWRLWCKFLDDYSRFEDWLRTAERTAANPVSADVLYTSAKEELKKFEAFQRQVHERLTQLELVNKQYRRLARENRTDASSKLKVMVHEGNQRWDSLQKRVAAILRRLKHFTSQREDFEGTREGILVWLTEMDLQLTNVEHFSESDIEDKMRQLNGFQQEITLNTNKIDALIVFGENLIQKSAPLDAVLIEDELEELHSYCQEVFGRVARFHHRLINRRPVLEEERDLSDRDTDLEESAELAGSSWGEEDEEEKEEDESRVTGELLGRQAGCRLLAPPLECSGRETPVSVDSIPLEWDHTVDVGGSSSHEDEEDATYYSLMIVLIGSDIGMSVSVGQVKLMSECSGSIDSVKRVKLILNDEELEDQGLTTLTTADKQTGVIERWELLQAQALSDELCIKQDLQQWQKLNSDLNEITSWLGHVLPELERLQRLAPATSIRDMEGNIRRLKEMQKTFNSYKSLMISINLSGQDFQCGDSAELQELQEGLRTANHSWTQACVGLESWEERLQSALMQCQEFHETLHSMLLWLARSESLVSLVPPALLQALEEELHGRQRQVSSLQEISSQLLLEATAEDSVEAKEKVHVIGNKLRLLLRQVANDLHILQGRLVRQHWAIYLYYASVRDCPQTTFFYPFDSNVHSRTNAFLSIAREEKGDSSSARPFFYRVLRAAFPLHLLFLLLLVLACLVPLSEEDYSCALSNNFARSFYPMLRYTNGPPPT